MTDIIFTPAADDDPSFTPTTTTNHNTLPGRSTADAHPASAITTDNDWNGNLTAAGTNLAAVLDVIDDLALGGGGGAVDSVNGETGTVVLDAADVDAVPTTRTITAGTGLTGGGDLAADRTIAADLSASNGAALGVAAPGVATTIARADHVHPMPSASDVGGVPVSLIDAAGDLIVGTADNTVGRMATTTFGRARLADNDAAAARAAIGPSGTADSTTYLRGDGTWAAPSGGGGHPVAYLDNTYHLLSRQARDLPSSTAMVPGANTLTATLVEIVEPVQISGRWMYVQTSAASAVFRPGLYARDTATGLPTGSPVLTTPAVNASSTGYKTDTFTASATIAPGLYWAVTASSHAVAAWRGLAAASELTADMGHAPGGTTSVRCFTSPWTYDSGALPDVTAFTWTAGTSETFSGPYIRWRTERV